MGFKNQKRAFATHANLGDILADAMRDQKQAFRVVDEHAYHYTSLMRKETSKPEIAGLKAIRKAFIQYTENPQDFIDFTSKEKAYDRYGNRIHGAFTFRPKTLEEVVGLKHLGDGCYADGYAINDKFVLKVIKNRDTGYARFVELIKKYPNNPHFPKVYYSGTWAGKTVYILERLKSTDNTIGGYDTSQYLRDAVRQWDRVSDNPYMGVTYKDPMIEELARVLCENHMTGDLHDGNIMYRNGVPVVTDPTTS